MKKSILIAIFFFSFVPAFAEHLKGGFFTYEYIPGAPAGSNRYHVTLTVYMICNPNAGQITNPISFTFFNNSTGQIQRNESVSISSQFQLRKTRDEECLTGDQTGCYYYIIIYDLASVDLPISASGYTVSYQRCCRIIDIKNMQAPSNAYGNTYSINIPGSSTPFNGQQNSSAQFLINDTAVVCGGSFFEVPFIATDPDFGDSLSYAFCAAWTGGGQAGSPPNGPNTPTPDPSAPPPYGTIPYAAGFSGSSPLGSLVNINPRTGLISGIAPNNSGEYVVTVCVSEWRQGVLIGGSRKELHLKVGQCAPIQATLDPQYVTCDGFTRAYFNQTNNGVQTFFWDFGVSSQSDDTSILATPSFTFPDTGVYVIKLVVNRGQACSDSTTSIQKVYPGFFPGFTVAGICVNKPTQFFDTTKTKYGFVDSWRWDFGDLATNADTSRIKNPTYTYPVVGVKNIRFIVTNSKGCVDTVFQDVTIMDKPPLFALPADTLICNGDNLQLNAIGNGIFSWTPGTNIINANTATPTVNPTVTTNYIVQLDDNGCINKDTVRVRVVDFVSLQARADTVICLGDSVRLTAITNGLSYSWSPSATIDNPTALSPNATPAVSPTTYILTSTIGHCNTTDDVTVFMVPYPGSNAGPDTIICYNSSAQLNGTMVGSSFSWSPASSLSNPNILNPVATPAGTTSYVLSVNDVLGCPKPKRDTVVVTVLPKVNAFAGRDTAVVVGQPLQFNATGGISYLWSPGTSLNQINIPNPKGVYNGSFDSITYKVIVRDQAGCADSAFITVKIFNTFPQIFVPTAFTPNGDGKNDYFRPIAVGISQFDYFRVYNRWGQLVYSSTNTEGFGWDGRIGGKEQGSNTFVWVVKGVDFTGKLVFAKGTVTLIR